ncbi:STELLO glycosyltransferase family protein [Kosmotoga pacifica]|uniref:DUF288 domain-containing protein n=1 Tax=Kosmotoga pacifica TaxID=1330330 RepID=A0A0G2Z503_9BACT|nr:STELLO glycosyltransferase family protein [Kosmotoga pacifica]AKI96632.1 hypothetical protein IX53_01005 [Kosmotoga pacifica]
MNQYIVITTIFPPSEAIKTFASTKAKVIVIGDTKTPNDWNFDGVDYYSPNRQKQLGLNILKRLPWNHYSRKMIGYLVAMKAGASIIIDTDDDNIPYPNYCFPEFEGRFLTVCETGFKNVYSYFTEKSVWPRGFDLELITSPTSKIEKADLKIEKHKIGVWQGLADNDPDVDAIYRLTNNSKIIFKKEPPIVLKSGSICPFNSQNTAFRAELFPLLYLPAYVSFRFTDILRGFVAQPIMWTKGYTLGFCQATVYQERNVHNYLKDFESEIPVYLNAGKIVEIVSKGISSSKTINDNLLSAYEKLYKEKIVPIEELELLELWLRDVSEI